MSVQLANGFGPADVASGAFWTPQRRTVEPRLSEWETAFFGSRMGAIVRLDEAGPDSAGEVRAQDLQTAVAKARTDGFAHLIFRAAGNDVQAIWAAEAAGLRLVDVGVDSTFTFATTPRPALDRRLPIRSGRLEDVPSLRELTVGAFTHTRFAVDPFFSTEQVTAFYQEWATNLFTGLADAVLVYEIDGQVAGFISCAMKGDEGRIPLVATAAAHRGRGVGRALVSAALDWFASAGARRAHVKTQATNYSALALYHRSGFCISNTEVTFSLTLEPR